MINGTLSHYASINPKKPNIYVCMHVELSVLYSYHTTKLLIRGHRSVIWFLSELDLVDSRSNIRVVCLPYIATVQPNFWSVRPVISFWFEFERREQKRSSQKMLLKFILQCYDGHASIGYKSDMSSYCFSVIICKGPCLFW